MPKLYVLIFVGLYLLAFGNHALANNEAQHFYDLGNQYFDGKEVERNDKQAFEWYEKSAELGDKRAQAQLALMYLEGLGVDQNHEKSLAIIETLNMKKVAHFPNVSFKFGQWVDIGYWQLSLLETSN